MALFKVSQGPSSNLNTQALTEGFCWFTPDDGKFYIDAKKNNALTRIPLNAHEADRAYAITTDRIEPMLSKTFTGVIGTTNSWAGATFFFGSIRPKSWYEPWRIKYRIRTYVPDKNGYDQIADVMISGDQNIVRSYSSMNTIGPYYVAYYHELYRLKQTGFTNGFGHSLGLRFYSAYNPVDTNYKRTIIIDIISTENCTFSFYDSCLAYSAIPGTGSTNYDSYTEINYVSNGLQETSDSDTIDDRSTYFTGKTSSSKGIWAGSLFMEDGDGTYQNICAASDGTITNSNRTTATTKIANTSGFRVGSKIFYSNSNYNANTNITGWGVVYYQTSIFDARYAFNVTLINASPATPLTAYKPVYLVGTIGSDGLYYLDPIWWTQNPTTTGKVYVLVGGCYDCSSSYCRITLYQHNPWYHYDGTKLVDYMDGLYVKQTAGVTNVAYDATNKKFTKTINGTTSNIVTLGTIKTDLAFTAADLNLNNVSNNQALNNVSGAKGDIIYWSATNTPAHLAVESSTTKKFLTVTSQVPSWVALSKSDVGLSNVTNHAQVTAVTWDSTNKKLQQSVSGGTPIDIVTAGTIKSALELTKSDVGLNNVANVDTTNASNITSGTLSADRLATSGVTAGSYGPSANTSPTHGSGFTVPYITVDNKGRITSASTKTITLPPDNNNAVTQTATTTNANYEILFSGTADNTTRTEGARKGANLTYNPSTNQLSTGNAQFTGELQVTGDTYLNNQTYAEGITTNSLLVNGATSFAQIPSAPTAPAGTNNTQLATTQFVYNAFTANDAMVFKGVVNSNSDLPATHYQGWTYKIGTAGTYAGQTCEVGDTIYCVTDGTSANNAHWVVVQNNIDILPVSRGGTGATTAAAARSNLGLGSIATKADTAYVPFKGNLTSLGQGSPAAATKTYWADVNNIPSLSTALAYNNSGSEYSLLFSKGDNNTYGSILKWGYPDSYIRILRYHSSRGSYSGWYSEDWEKISAGYADSAGSATKATQDGSGNNIVSTYLTKSAGVTAVTWDSTNKKLTKTINGTTSDVVTAGTIKTALGLTKSDVGLGNVPNTDATNASNISSGTLSADRLATSGATAGSYGPSANASPAHGSGFSVPYVTVDNKGRVTAISTKTITLPPDNNTDTKVTQTVKSDNAEYPILAKDSTAITTTTATSNFTDGITINPQSKTISTTGFIKTNKGAYAYQTGSENVSGYFKFATLVVSSSYVNCGIQITYTSRSRTGGIIYLMFNNVSGNDPTLTVTRTGPANIYYKKSTTSTWDLYINKTEKYDDIVFNIINPGQLKRGSVALTWNNTSVTNLPTDYLTADIHTIAENISGNAATATVANSANAIAWEKVTGKPSTSITWTNGTTAGPTLTVTAAGSSSSAIAVPSASLSQSGIITTSDQKFLGQKTFKYTPRVYPLLKAAPTRSTWYKITFPYNGTTATSTRWFMLSFDLVVGNAYRNNAVGTIHVAYGFSKAANDGAYTAQQVYAHGNGIKINSIKLYYQITAPGILYVNAPNYAYNNILIKNLICDDTNVDIDQTNTTIETCDAITIANFTQVPMTSIGTDDGTTIQLWNNTKVNGNTNLNGAVTVPHTASATDGVKITYSSTIDFFMGVGTGNVNHGLYDNKAGKWVLSAGADNIWSLAGNAATATSAGSATSATKATQDGNGNVISSTYLKLSGGTMTGGVTFIGNQTSAYNDQGIIFTKGSRIGENTNGGIGVYGVERVYIRPGCDGSSSGDGIEITTSGVIPSNNNTETLGDSSHTWSNVYATTFTGALSGNATSATKATKDGDNNTISSTYLKLAGGQMTGAIGFGATGMNRAILQYNSTYPNYGIWYNDSGTDTMRFSASGNANTDAGADLCINGNGDGTVTIRGNTILHAGNYSATCDTRYVKKAGDTMTGNLILKQASMPSVAVTETNNSTTVYLHSSSGNHGIYSNGYYNGSSFTSSGAWIIYRSTDGQTHSTLKIYGAVWNDYAEYRKDNPNENQEPGRCIKELGDGSLALTTKRLERGCEIVSDTFGFAIGQDIKNGYNTPIASNGRVLAYPYESIEEFANHIGWSVCSGPNGTVSIMTEEEEEKYPSRIIGTISEIPTYKTWGTGNVEINGRIWIRIR